MRRWRRLFAKLLRLALLCPSIFCRFRAHGTICIGQRGSCRPHETLGGVAQTGKAKLHTPRNLFKSWKRKIVLKKLRNAAMGAIIILLLFIIVRFFSYSLHFFFLHVECSMKHFIFHYHTF